MRPRVTRAPSDSRCPHVALPRRGRRQSELRAERRRGESGGNAVSARSGGAGLPELVPWSWPDRPTQAGLQSRRGTRGRASSCSRPVPTRVAAGIRGLGPSKGKGSGAAASDQGPGCWALLQTAPRRARPLPAHTPEVLLPIRGWGDCQTHGTAEDTCPPRD